MIVGFTGTQKGMTAKQEKAFEELIIRLNPDQFHHGACKGADAQAVIILCTTIPGLTCEVVAHPCTISHMVDPVALELSEIVHDPEEPLVRNLTIATVSDVLIATPKKYFEELRSGTWATVRYMQKLSKPVHIIRPNGDTKIIG